MQSQKQQNDLSSSPRQNIQHYSNPNLCPATDAKEAEVDQFYEELQQRLKLTPQKDVIFIRGDWNAKVGNQKISGKTGKFGLAVQNEAGQRLSFVKRIHWSKQTPFSNNPRDNSTHGHNQMINTEITLTMFFAAKDGEVLNTQQKQDLELTRS